jgi:hypothetical protein
MSCIDNKCVFIQIIEIWVAWDARSQKTHSYAVTFLLECDSSVDSIRYRTEKDPVLYLTQGAQILRLSVHSPALVRTYLKIGRNCFIPHQPQSLIRTKSESYVTTDGQPASLSWNKAHFWGLRPDLYYCLTVAGLLIWGALSDERTGLSFSIATGLRQRSHFRVRVP